MNEQATEGRVSRAIAEYERQEEPGQTSFSPETEHSPVDATLQTGESRALGGAMRKRLKWNGEDTYSP